MKTSRAMTLIELLVSLSLLAVISMVGASWMSASLGTQSVASDDASWNRSAAAALGLIEQDLFAVDRLDSSGRRGMPRVEVDGPRLRIRTRDNGYTGVIEYLWNAEGKRIVRGPISEDSGGSEPPLLGDVAVFSVQIEQQSEIVPLPVLRVWIERSDGHSLRRTYTLSIEDTQ